MLFPYQDKDTRIHRLDARPKMAFVLSVFLISILVSDIFYLAVLFALVMAIVAAAGVARATLGLLRYTVYVAAFLFLFSIFFAQGSHVLFSMGPVKITRESLLFATSMTFRLFLAVSAFSVMTFAIHPDQLLRALSKFGLKSMTSLSIATRMYPTIAADSRNIEDAMRARGAELDDGSFVRKARARAPVMMPLLLNSLDRSMEIAEAMESRGFGTQVRTRYFDRPLSPREKLMTALFLAAVPFGVAMFILGFGNADYLAGAVLSASGPDTIAALALALFYAPMLLGEGI